MEALIDIIEFVLTHKAQIKEAVAIERVDSHKGHVSTGGAGSGHSKISDPTANKAIHEISELPSIRFEYGPAICGHRSVKLLNLPERWLKMSDNVLTFCKYHKDKKVLKFYVSRYERSEDYHVFCKDNECSRAVYYKLKDIVLHQAELYAVAHSLFNPLQWIKRHPR